jgi:hypothetical protein
MPRPATIAQADINRAVRALRGIGITSMRVRLEPDGAVVVEPCHIEGVDDKHIKRLESKRVAAL